MMHQLLHAVAPVLAERLMDSLAAGVVLAAFAWALLRIVPRQNAATRFAVWFAALVGTALLPLLAACLKQRATANLAPPFHPWISVPTSWALYLFAAWAVIAAAALLRFVIGLIELRRLRRSCCVMESAESWQTIMARACPARKVEILTTDCIHVPTAIGFIKPAVVIPASLLQELSAADLNQVLLHELAHLRRWDDWTNVAQKLVKALLFFHPAVWWMEERISLEREIACDDAVLAHISSPRAYAQCLARLAEKTVLRRSAALAQAAVNRVRQTTLRVARILDVNRPKSAPSLTSAVALLGGFACAFLVLVWHAPRLVAFGDAPPPLARMAPAPSINESIADPVTVTPPPSTRMVARQVPSPAVIQAKPTLADHPRQARPRQRVSTELAQQHGRVPRLIQAKASVTPQPAFVTSVLVIYVDDPVFGPTPVLWRFAVWQVPTPQQPAQMQLETPQKST